LTFADYYSLGGLSGAARDLPYGRTYFGNERTTFVIGADGVVAKVLRKVKPAEHDELVLAALEEAGPPVV
jgi:peroxiredoxin